MTIEEVDMTGIETTLMTVVPLLVVAGLVIVTLSVVYAVRTWRAQSAALATRRDVAEIKQILQSQGRSSQPARPESSDDIKAGPKIAG